MGINKNWRFSRQWGIQTAMIGFLWIFIHQKSSSHFRRLGMATSLKQKQTSELSPQQIYDYIPPGTPWDSIESRIGSAILKYFKYTLSFFQHRNPIICKQSITSRIAEQKWQTQTEQMNTSHQQISNIFLGSHLSIEKSAEPDSQHHRLGSPGNLRLPAIPSRCSNPNLGIVPGICW